jgi:hypothetical protein
MLGESLTADQLIAALKAATPEEIDKIRALLQIDGRYTRTETHTPKDQR